LVDAGAGPFELSKFILFKLSCAALVISAVCFLSTSSFPTSFILNVSSLSFPIL